MVRSYKERQWCQKCAMTKTMILLLTISIICGMFISNERTFASSSVSFLDTKGHWAEAAIEEAVSRGIIEGFPDHTFRPDDIVTADQLIVMLFRAYSHTYATAKGNQVRWDQNFLQRLNKDYPGRLGSLENALAEQPFYFQTNATGYWAQPFIDFAFAMGYLATYDTVFPKDYEKFQKPINREEASYMLGDWYENYESGFDGTYRKYAIQTAGLNDILDFSPSAVSVYRGTVLLAGIMRGYPGDNFYPKRYVTRAEAVSMILRVHDPELRVPYKPDLSHVCYSQTNDHNIHIFNDQVKCEAYRNIVDLAKAAVADGYVDVGTLGVSVFANQDEAEKNTRDWQLGLLNQIPRGELSLKVGDEGEQYIELVYNTDAPLTYSKPLFDEAIQLLAGKGNEQLALNALEKFKASGSQNTTIIVGDRSFKLSLSQHSCVLDYIYQ